jgi:hypothetical protein
MMKNKSEWEQQCKEGYSNLFSVIRDILNTKRELQQIYAQIDKSMASIKNALKKNPKQGQSIIKVKTKFWSSGEKNTLAGHVEGLEKSLESKFVSDTVNICGRVCNEFNSFDHKILGKFLRLHGVSNHKMNRLEREMRFEELVKHAANNKPGFYNVRRNSCALIRDLQV